MKGSIDIVSGIICLKQAYEHFESFRREYPGGKGDKLFRNYSQKITWIAKDLMTNPFLTDFVREGIKKEWESDSFTLPAITKKASLLRPDQRETIEEIIEHLLNGEEITITDIPSETQ